MGAAAATLIAAVALGMSLDVIQRNLGLGTWSWMLEACEYAIFSATFLGAPWVLRLGAHVRVDVLVHSLPRQVARILEIGGDAVGAIACTVLFYYAIVVVRGSIHDEARIIKMFIIPEWWVFAGIAFSLALLVIEFLRRLVVAIRGAAPAPPGAPAH
ncbi:MAG: TRAP transporter small permease [Rhodospirillaceae bacterium]|nr:TRAP transporter small permease [Rhodospirillaceae bacterium]